MKKIFVSGLFIMLLAGFGTCIKGEAQLTSDSFLIDGRVRTFHFQLPPSDRKKASLVFALHGSGGNGPKTAGKAKRLEALSEKENLLLVYPDGYKKNWNECRKSTPAAANTENIDENAFFLKMMDYCQRKFDTDPAKTFVIGTSGGGHMAYKLAFTMPEKIRAITAIVANIPGPGNMDCREAKKPMPVMIVNGTKDSTNPYNGGEMKKKGWVRSTEETFRYWAELSRYEGDPVFNTLPQRKPNDSTYIETYTYSAKGKPEVVLYKVINGTHANHGPIDVYLEAWDFFKREMARR